MSVYGINVGNTFLGEFPTINFIAKMNGRLIAANPSSKLISNVEGYDNIRCKTHTFKLESGEYVIFSKDNLGDRFYAPFVDNRPPPGEDDQQIYTTSALHIEPSGLAYFTAIYSRNGTVPLSNTDFYIFRNVQPSDQNEYGLSLFNELGKLTYTSSGIPLFVLGTVTVNCPEYVDSGPPMSGDFWYTETKRRDIAIMNTAPWTYNDYYGTGGKIWFYRFGLSVNDAGLVKTRPQTSSLGLTGGFVPDYWDQEPTKTVPFIDISKLKNTPYT